MDKAAYVLVGIVLGAVLGALKDLWFQSRAAKKGREYLAVRVSCLLDAFAGQCAEVVADDGLCMGQYDSTGRRTPQVQVPKFDPLGLDVDWASLPAALMDDVLSIPNRVDAANQGIEAAFTYAASPPDYEEGFEERQYQYAKLGLKAYEVASRLRGIANLQDQPPGSLDWNPADFMSRRLTDIEAHREMGLERRAGLMEATKVTAV